MSNSNYRFDALTTKTIASRVLVPVFATHYATQYIGIGHVQPSKVVFNLHHVFLIDHEAIDVFQLFPEHRVKVFGLFRCAVTFDTPFIGSVVC